MRVGTLFGELWRGNGRGEGYLLRGRGGMYSLAWHGMAWRMKCIGLEHESDTRTEDRLMMIRRINLILMRT